MLVCYSCDNPTPNGLIKKVQSNDTLTIETYISDCGEWGGHKEIFQIYQKDKSLWMNILCTWKDCVYDSIKKVGNKIELTKQLTTSDEKALTLYIDSASKYNGTYKPFDNATNIYKVYYKDSIHTITMGDKWLEYQKMTDVVLKPR